jgi:hypothetical protein
MKYKKQLPIEKRNRDFITKEIISAIKFFELQVKKGWAVQEAMKQMKSSYGGFIYGCVKYHFARFYKQHPEYLKP